MSKKQYASIQMNIHLVGAAVAYSINGKPGPWIGVAVIGGFIWLLALVCAHFLEKGDSQ